MKNTKPKVIGYIPLMYGKEYLDACIRSMAPFVEVIHIFYVSEPSQGHAASVPCPESEQELHDIAIAASDKVVWHKCAFGTEGEHRAEIYKYSEGYDLVLSLDADEVLDPEFAEAALLDAFNGDRRYYGSSSFVNFWRSFNEVCYDGFLPVRVINLHNDSPYTGALALPIYHFSCAQSETIIRYKWEVSGHKDELRPGWVDNILYGTSKIDVHPVSLGLWNVSPFNRHSLPDILQFHPNFNKESI